MSITKEEVMNNRAMADAILRSIEQCGYAEVTVHVVKEGWPGDAMADDPFMQLALAEGGHRPAMTAAQHLEFWCEQEDVRYRVDERGRYIFSKNPLPPTPER